MSTPNSTIVAFDIAKAKLDAAIHGLSDILHFPYTSEGIARILKWLQEINPTLIAMEATGGYERKLVKALSLAGYRITIIPPKRIRDFARAKHLWAKTDDLDALNIAEFAAQMAVRIYVPPTPAQEQLTALVTRRKQLSQSIISEKNRYHQAIDLMKPRVQKSIDFLENEIAQLNREIRDLIQDEPELKQKCDLMKSCKGIGQVTSATLATELPELGVAGNKQISALAGLAPYNNDSGKKTGKRYTRGGRYNVRAALYMATLTAVQFNPVLKPYYQHLLAHGKAKKVAMVACMHKLLIILNAMLRANKPFVSQQAFI